MKKDNYDVCIIGGSGHIRFPLGISFADSGKKLVLYDINQKTIDRVSQGNARTTTSDCSATGAKRHPFLGMMVPALRVAKDSRLLISLSGSEQGPLWSNRLWRIYIG
jgi:UDP-N-acetyl-D-mannosaminuronate dehydrogenase